MTMLGWFVFEQTGSPFLVTLVGFSGMGPLVVLGVFGGVLAERVDKRRLLLGTLFANLIAAALMAALIFSDMLLSTSLLQFWHAYVVMLVGGIGWGLDMPSRRSIVLDVLGRARVNNAVALDSIGMHSSRMIGPLLGGALITASRYVLADGYGLEAGYAATLVFFVASATMLLKMRTMARQAPAAAQPAMSARAVSASGSFKDLVRDRLYYAAMGVWAIIVNLIQGFDYVWGHSTLRAVVLITVFMNLLLFPYQQLIPVVAGDVLMVGATLMGLLLAVEGFGALIGSTLIASAVQHDASRAGIFRRLDAWAANAAAVFVFGVVRRIPIAYADFGLGNGGLWHDAGDDNPAGGAGRYARQGLGHNHACDRRGPNRRAADRRGGRAHGRAHSPDDKRGIGDSDRGAYGLAAVVAAGAYDAG